MLSLSPLNKKHIAMSDKNDKDKKEIKKLLNQYPFIPEGAFSPHEPINGERPPIGIINSGSTSMPINSNEINSVDPNIHQQQIYQDQFREEMQKLFQYGYPSSLTSEEMGLTEEEKRLHRGEFLDNESIIDMYRKICEEEDCCYVNSGGSITEWRNFPHDIHSIEDLHSVITNVPNKKIAKRVILYTILSNITYMLNGGGKKHPNTVGYFIYMSNDPILSIGIKRDNDGGLYYLSRAGALHSMKIAGKLWREYLFLTE